LMRPDCTVKNARNKKGFPQKAFFQPSR